MKRWLGSLALSICLLLGTLIAATPSLAQTTIRAVMHSDIKIFDPIWSHANIARIHGYMVWDTLFAMDANFKVHPQMVDTWSVSDDKLAYTFTLRDGLVWNDGTPVTSEDCVASIKRWAARDPMGQKLLDLMRDFAVVDARSFRIVLKEPFGLVLESLAKQAIPVPFIMPKRLAETDPFKQITEVVGSGPFVFSKDEWRPGERVVYVKNPRYKPRSEPMSGLAGGKVVKVDRVEWLALSDPQTAFNALRAGEIDLLERVSADLLPTAEKTRDVTLWAESTTTQYLLRLNWLHAPFNTQKIRAAAAMALNQEDFLEALNGNPRFYRACKSVFPCGTPHASDVGTQGWLESNAQKARQMLQEGGYDGTPVVFLQTTDIPITNNAGPVVKSLLERAGFRVQLQAMDWQSLSARLNKKEAPAEGGWNAYLAAPPGIDMVDPFINQNMLSTCGRARVGWPCDETMEKLRDAYARETDLAKRQAIAAETQKHFFEVWTYIPLGEFFHVGAVRSSLDVPARAAVPVFWGMARR
jgi:peptide/nickel transport system substrate-binding protein